LPIVAKQIERWPRCEGLIVVMCYGKSSAFAELKLGAFILTGAHRNRQKMKSRLAGGLSLLDFKGPLRRSTIPLSCPCGDRQWSPRPGIRGSSSAKLRAPVLIEPLTSRLSTSKAGAELDRMTLLKLGLREVVWVDFMQVQPRKASKRWQHAGKNFEPKVLFVA
jgi:hypothetical protein